jgi:hypothetical protein
MRPKLNTELLAHLSLRRPDNRVGRFREWQTVSPSVAAEQGKRRPRREGIFERSLDPRPKKNVRATGGRVAKKQA